MGSGSVVAASVETGVSVTVSVSPAVGSAGSAVVSAGSADVLVSGLDEVMVVSVPVSEVAEPSAEVSVSAAGDVIVTLGVLAAVSVARLGGATSSQPVSQTVTARLAAKAASLNVDGLHIILNGFS